MKVYINCYMPEQILDYWKFWFLRYGLKALGQSDWITFKSNISRAK